MGNFGNRFLVERMINVHGFIFCGCWCGLSNGCDIFPVRSYFFTIQKSSSFFSCWRQRRWVPDFFSEKIAKLFFGWGGGTPALLFRHRWSSWSRQDSARLQLGRQIRLQGNGNLWLSTTDACQPFKISLSCCILADVLLQLFKFF